MKRGHRRLTIAGLTLLIGLVGYSLFFRTYLDDQAYLTMALAATGNDPTIINADEPAFEVIWHKGHASVHMVFLTASDGDLGSIDLYIDVFAQKVESVERLDYVLELAPFP